MFPFILLCLLLFLLYKKVNPFTAPACKISGLKDARTRQQTVYFPVLYHIYFFIVQELCESRGGRPGLSVLMSLLVSVDVKRY